MTDVTPRVAQRSQVSIKATRKFLVQYLTCSKYKFRLIPASGSQAFLFLSEPRNISWPPQNQLLEKTRAGTTSGHLHCYAFLKGLYVTKGTHNCSLTWESREKELATRWTTQRKISKYVNITKVVTANLDRPVIKRITIVSVKVQVNALMENALK